MGGREIEWKEEEREEEREKGRKWGRKGRYVYIEFRMTNRRGRERVGET